MPGRRERDGRWRESEGKGGEGDPFSERDRNSGERERRGLRDTEVGVVTERMSERVCVCVCMGEQVVLQWKQCEEDCSFWC